MTLVTPARPADLPELGDVLADAFLADPPTLTLLPPTLSRRRARIAALFRALLISGPLAEGTVDVARDPHTGAVLGAAIWQAPGRRSAGVLHYVPRMVAFLRAFGLRGLGPAVAAARALASNRPTGAHWYLQAVGVRAEMRGRGVGSRLLRYRLAVADAHDGAAYLESSTEATSALYRRHGFVALSPVTGFPGSVVPTAMWRAARGSAEQGGAVPTSRGGVRRDMPVDG